MDTKIVIENAEIFNGKDPETVKGNILIENESHRQDFGTAPAAGNDRRSHRHRRCRKIPYAGPYRRALACLSMLQHDGRPAGRRTFLHLPRSRTGSDRHPARGEPRLYAMRAAPSSD